MMYHNRTFGPRGLDSRLGYQQERDRVIAVVEYFAVPHYTKGDPRVELTEVRPYGPHIS